jgi:parallel beta-helix repeat protein
LFLATLLLISSPCSSLQARTVHVSTYTALRNACVQALPGDTIIVAPGTYTITGATRIMISNRPGPVLLRGATGNPADVVIRGQGQDNNAVLMVFNLDNSPRWTFRDLTVRDSYYHGFKYDGSSTDCSLINVIMRDHGESGVKGTSNPAIGVWPDRLLVDSCDIGFTQASGGTRSVVEGVDGVGVNDWIIRNSRFVNVQKNGAPAYAIFTKGNSSNTIIEGNRFENCFIAASFGGGGTGAQFFRDNDQTYEHRNGIIRNNIMMRCTDAGVYINKGVNCRISNNTLFECVLTIQLRFPQSSGYVRNNLVLRAPTNPNEPVVRLRDGATLLGAAANLAAISADFVQSAGGFAQLDLHLAASSQAIDAGVDLPSDVPYDIEGQNRPSGGGWDVGAYEFNIIPIQLALFTASLIDGAVILRWRTETESGNHGFELQRAGSGDVYRAIAFLPGAGTTTQRREYSYVDSLYARHEPLLRYRLRQLDYSGASSYYELSVVNAAGEAAALEMHAWPNPSTGHTAVHARTVERADIFLFDALGRMLYRESLDAGKHFIRMHVPTPGLYLLALRGAASHTALRLVVQ